MAGHSNKQFLIGLIAGGAVGALVCGAVLTRNIGMISSQQTTSTSGSMTAQSQRKLQSLEQLIDRYYYRADEISQEDKEEGLYKGLLESLDDPYSVYYTADEYKALSESITGQYGGIGAYISYSSTGYPMIAGVMKNTPAEEAGLLENDIIYKVDGTLTEGMDLDTVVSLVKGEEGTDVVLTVIRSTEAEDLEITVTRRIIDSPSVESEVLEDNIGYIRISSFDTVTTNQFKTALEDLYSQNIAGLIIDLRSNPGGDVDTVTAIADQILPEGLVFYMEDRNGNRTEYKCDGKNEIQIPLVVLVNGNSASASEIFSGAVQDAGVGTIVGTQTYGKGVVQAVHDMADGSAVKITIAGYFTRGGHDIDGVGITPDVEIALDSAAYIADGSDNQLDKALEIIEEQISK